MADISGFLSGDAVNRALEKAGIESTPQEIGIAGFRLYSRIRERVNYQADAPISYVENGAPINDHRIMQPVLINITGNAGDVYLPESNLASAIGRVQAEIGNVTQYLPDRTQTQASKIIDLISDVTDAVRRIESIIDSGEQILDLFRNSSDEANPIPLQFIEAMEKAYRTYQPLDVETRYKKYTSMVITNMVFESNSADDSINFSIDFQEWRVADVEFVQVARNPSSGAADAISGKQDKGVQSGEDVDQSLLSTILESIGLTQ